MTSGRERSDAGPLADIRVLLLGAGAASPVAGRCLAALGAEVIRVESARRPDVIRQFTPAWAGTDLPPTVRGDLGPMWTEFNVGTLSVGLDVSVDAGRETFMKLVGVSDVVLSNLSATVLPGLGLGYDNLVTVRPNLIFCSLPSFGNQPSRYHGYRTFGPNQAPLASLDHLTGWPDRPPSGIGGFAYPDFLTAYQTAFAIASAVFWRDATGEGQFIDISQYEATVAAIGPILIDQAANGHVQGATGNRSGRFAPEGIYPSAGEDRWIAISCDCDRAWHALCVLAAGEEFASDVRFAKHQQRLALADELDEALGLWTSRYTNRDLAERLQAAGVIASIVADGPDIVVDPQIESRGGLVVTPHARLGNDLSAAFPPKLSASAPDPRRGAPCLGEHNTYVLEELAGLTPDRRRQLAEEGVVFEMKEVEQKFQRPYLPWARYFLRNLAAHATTGARP